MKIIVTLAVGLVALWGLLQFGALTKAPAIQADIQERTAAAIANAGLENARVSVDGRDVILGGTVASDEQEKQAVEIARAVHGVRVATSVLTIEADQVYYTQFCKKESRIILSGSVPNEAAREEFPQRAGDLFRHRTIDADLVVRGGAPDGYRRFMDHALTELGQLDEGCVTLRGQDVLVEGTVRNARAKTRIESRVALVDELGFVVTLKLRLPSLSEQAIACQEAYDEILGPGEAVLFDFDSATIHAAGRQLLDEILEIATLCPDVSAIVAGHADSIGNKEYNIDLSERRADAVVAYAVNQGIAPDRLKAVGYGFSQPVADNSTDEGRAQNRRIEFRVLED